jgi:hypothetical protein
MADQPAKEHSTDNGDLNMKVTLTNGKPTAFDMNEGEVQTLLIDHINMVLQQKFDQSTNVDVGSSYFNSDYNGLNGFEGDITTNPDTPTITEVEL